MRSDPDGQPGYQALAVVHHESLPCEIPGRECGAVVKVWPDAEAALADAEHQAAMAAVGPGFGSAISVSAGRVVVFVDPALDAADAEAILEAVRSLR